MIAQITDERTGALDALIVTREYGAVTAERLTKTVGSTLYQTRRLAPSGRYSDAFGWGAGSGCAGRRELAYAILRSVTGSHQTADWFAYDYMAELATAPREGFVLPVAAVTAWLATQNEGQVA